MSEFKCDSCQDTGMASKDGILSECKCVFNRRLAIKMETFLPAPKSNPEIIRLLKVIEKIKHPRKVFVSKMPKDLYKTFFIHYLVRNNLTSDFKVMPLYLLYDLIMGSIEDQTVYDISQGTILFIYGIPDAKKAQELNFIETFIDLYKDRDIIFYSDTSKVVELRTLLLSKNFKLF